MTDRAEPRRTSPTVVAIAGIAATAVVGIAASTTTWVVARDDRDTQIALARDERIYEKRSSAYVDTLMATQTLSDDMRLLRFETVPTWPDFQRDQASLRARMSAFATLASLRLYNAMFFSASRALSAIERLRESDNYLDQRVRAQLWRTNSDVRSFEQARRAFQLAVEAEVGDARGDAASPADTALPSFTGDPSTGE